MLCRQTVFVLAWLLFASIGYAHDLWLIPPRTALPKQAATIDARVGMDFPRSEFAPDTERYPRKFVIQPDGKSLPLKSAGKKDLSGLLEFEPTIAGVHVIAVETTPKVLELDAERFNEYLVTDGLPHIYRLRAKEKTLDKPAKERYRKSPTALVQVGDVKAGAWNKALDLPLQIVPLQDPFGRKVGDTLRVCVYFQKKPLADANLGWQRPGDGDTAGGTVRTDAKGEALIPIAASGLMTIRLTHMTRPKTADYEWESFWTTLTFRVP
ncbi:MAG: DUF4198 domain-containing protein [Planctomycetes bacterium]|nr:DUF4198 domain-containing protein [Planctomycetota bacterium]